MLLFSIPIVKTPRKTIIHFTTKQNNVQAFVNLLICLVMLFRRQYFLQVFVRFYFLVEFTTEKASITEIILTFASKTGRRFFPHQ